MKTVKLFFLSIFLLLTLSCEIIKPNTILVANLTSRGYITQVICNGYPLFMFQGGRDLESTESFDLTFKPGQRREFIVPSEIEAGVSLEWTIVFYHNKVDSYFSYPEKQEVYISSGVFFGNGDWLDLIDDTEVKTKTESEAYLSDLLGGIEISIQIDNETDFNLRSFSINDHNLDFFSVSSKTSVRKDNIYNSKDGRVAYLSFTVEYGSQVKRVRLYQPRWFGESFRLPVRPTTAVQEVDLKGNPLSSNPVLLENLFPSP